MSAAVGNTANAAAAPKGTAADNGKPASALSSQLSRMDQLVFNGRVLDCARTGDTLLLPALLSKGGHVETTKLLLSNGADPNKQDKTGQTALHRAVETNQRAVVDCLLAKSRIDVEIVDANGLTALALATKLNEKSPIHAQLVKAHAAIAKRKAAELKKAEEEDRRRRAQEEKLLRETEKQKQKQEQAPRKNSLPGLNKSDTSSTRPLDRRASLHDTAAEEVAGKADRWMSMIYSSEDSLSDSGRGTPSPTSTDSPRLTGSTAPLPIRLLQKLGRTTSESSLERASPPTGRSPSTLMSGQVAQFTPEPVVNKRRSQSDLQLVADEEMSASASVSGFTITTDAATAIPSAAATDADALRRTSPPPADAGLARALATAGAKVTSPASNSLASASSATSPPSSSGMQPAQPSVGAGSLPQGPPGAPKPERKSPGAARAAAATDSGLPADSEALSKLPISREDMLRRRREAGQADIKREVPSLMQIMKRFSGEEDEELARASARGDATS